MWRNFTLDLLRPSSRAAVQRGCGRHPLRPARGATPARRSGHATMPRLREPGRSAGRSLAAVVLRAACAEAAHVHVFSADGTAKFWLEPGVALSERRGTMTVSCGRL